MTTSSNQMYWGKPVDATIVKQLEQKSRTSRGEILSGYELGLLHRWYEQRAANPQYSERTRFLAERKVSQYSIRLMREMNRIQRQGGDD